MSAYTELLPPQAHRTPEWYEARRPGIGASEIAAILGLAPKAWASPFTLWHRKKGLLEEEPDNDAMYWGRILEDRIVARFQQLHPELEVTQLGLCASKRDPWAMCTPDGVAFDAVGPAATDTRRLDTAEPIAGIEAKTTDTWEGWGETGSDQIPVYYRCQVLWQMLVLGVDVVYVPVLSRGKSYREYVIIRDADAQADLEFMVARANEFRALLEGDVPPPVDEAPATFDALKTLHPEVEERSVEVADYLAETYFALRAEIDGLTVDLQGTLNEILVAVGDAKRAVDAKGRIVVSRSVYPQHRVDVSRLKEERPEIAKEFDKVIEVHKVNPGKPPEPRPTTTIRSSVV